MDTAEEARQVAGSPVEITYDGFLSYSHAADDLLAPRLQAGLQRFAKPWWKRRALRIFRDEASLTANPHLWSSITEALDGSAWFVLLLSPDAAASEWVDREVHYWLSRKDPRRIIPVLTDGEFRWEDGHLVSDAAPPALGGAFTDEPRWVDLRFARTEHQLDLKNPRFSAAVADVAAALRGVPKDELESEEVRQHRRAVRTAWAAGIGLTGLLILSVLFGILAFNASGRATAEAERASGFALQLLDYVAQLEVGAPPKDYVMAEYPGIIPVGQSAPANPRLDFLAGFCNPGRVTTCTRDAVFIHPELPIAESVWLAYEPFHIREGFVTGDVPPDRASSEPGFDVAVYVTRVFGPELEPGVFEIDRTYRFATDYVVNEMTDRCGPGYRTQTGPLPCDLFVHDFPEGLPPGRYDFWVEWRAPCQSWSVGLACESPSEIMSLFAASVNSPFYHETWTPHDEGNPRRWPFDPWEEASPLPFESG